MLSNKVITKAKFKDFLSKTFITKQEVSILMSIFKYVRNVDAHDKLMYLLYNEYISYLDVLFCMYDEDTAKVGEEDENGNVTTTFNFDYIIDNINALINRVAVDNGIIFYVPVYKDDGKTIETFINDYGQEEEHYIDASYGYMKSYFVRDYITTLTYKYYKDNANYLDQLDVVYTALDPIEKEFLKNVCGITKNTFNMFVRKQTDENVISHADIEGASLYGFSVEPELHLGSINNNNDTIGENYTKSTTTSGFEADGTPKDGAWHTIGYTREYSIKNSTEKMNLYRGGYVRYNKAEDKWETNDILTITQLSEILNCTDESDPYYWFEAGNQKKSRRSLLLSVLKKIDMGTIH